MTATVTVLTVVGALRHSTLKNVSAACVVNAAFLLPACHMNSSHRILGCWQWHLITVVLSSLC